MTSVPGKSGIRRVASSDDPIAVRVLGGPVGPPGPPGRDGTGVSIKGSVTGGTWPPSGSYSPGDMVLIGTPAPSGLPAGVKSGDGMVWDGSAWTHVGSIQGPAGPAGPQGAAGPAGPTAVSADSGNYSRIGTDAKIFTPTPTLATLGAAAAAHTHTAGQVSGLATVATSGLYADLSGAPAIPTKLSQLSNDTQYVDSAGAKAAAPVQKIVAGANVSVSDNGAGVVTVASTGTAGGGITAVWNRPPIQVADFNTEPVISVDAATTSSLGVVKLADDAAASAGTAGVVVDAAQLKAVKDGAAAASHTHTAGQVTGLATVATTGAYADLSGKPEAYVLPVATASVLGGVKAGSGVTIAGDGTISASGGGGSGDYVARTGDTMTGALKVSGVGGTSTNPATATASIVVEGDGLPALDFIRPTSGQAYRMIVSGVGGMTIQERTDAANPLSRVAFSAASGSNDTTFAVRNKTTNGSATVLHLSETSFNLSDASNRAVISGQTTGGVAVLSKPEGQNDAFAVYAFTAPADPFSTGVVAVGRGDSTQPVLEVQRCDKANGNILDAMTFGQPGAGGSGGQIFTVQRGSTAEISLTEDAFSVMTGGAERLLVTASGTTIAGNTYPITKGTSGQVLTTNGTGTLSWSTVSGGGGGSKTIARFTPRDNQPPASGFAQLDTRNSILVLEFDALNEESAFFAGVVPEGALLASGITVRIFWTADTATSGNVRWGVQLEKSGTDIDGDSFDAAAQATSAANATSGIESVASITITTIDGLAAGDRFSLRVFRAAADATNDTMLGDAQLLAVELRAA